MQPESLYSLPLEQQIGQFFFIGLPGTELDKATRDLIAEVQPGGVIIFGRNVASPEQLRSLLDGIREMLPTPPLVGVDQEGGRVARLKAPFTEWPPMATLGRSGDAALAERFARALASEYKKGAAKAAGATTVAAIVASSITFSFAEPP